MMKLSKILLAVALVSFVVGVVELTRPGGWGICIPVGAVFLGLYCIERVLAKEAARFDEEQKQREQSAGH